MVEKRFQYWGFANGKAQIMWTQWFPWNSTLEEEIQAKGFKGNHLKNEYREV